MRTFLNKQEVKEYYSFKEKLGSGFFATVYRGIEKKSGKKKKKKRIVRGKGVRKEGKREKKNWKTEKY